MADAKTIQIKNAVLTRLETITVANGYRSDIGEVSRSYKKHDQFAAWPACQAVFNDRRSKMHGLSCKRSELRVVVECKAEGEGAELAAANLAADVEQCLEAQTGGQWLGGLLTGFTVFDVLVEDDLPVELPKEIARGVFTWAVVVVITYKYRRGQP